MLKNSFGCQLMWATTNQKVGVSGKEKEKEKQSFYDELKGEWYAHSEDDFVMCLGDFNGQDNVYFFMDGMV